MRPEAYRRLGEVAEYLSRTDPHSPVPYLLHRAVAWEALPLDELLAEFARKDGPLAKVLEWLRDGGDKIER